MAITITIELAPEEYATLERDAAEMRRHLANDPLVTDRTRALVSTWTPADSLRGLVTLGLSNLRRRFDAEDRIARALGEGSGPSQPDNGLPPRQRTAGAATGASDEGERP